MDITKFNPLTQKHRTIDIPIKPEHLERFNNGEHIQDVAPYLSPSEREFIVSGILGDEFDDLFQEQET